MAILVDKNYIKIIKDKCYLQATEADGIFSVYCAFESYTSKKARDAEKKLLDEKTQFVNNLIKYKYELNPNDLDYSTETISAIEKVLSTFEIYINIKPEIPEDLEIMDILVKCGYKERWYETEIEIPQDQGTLLIQTVNLTKIKTPINYEFFYNNLKNYLLGKKVDV